MCYCVVFWRLWEIAFFFVPLFFKIKAYLLTGKFVLQIWNFLLERIEYQRLFYWQYFLEIYIFFNFMRVYKFCSISNIDQTIKNVAMAFSYYVEGIMNTKICEIYGKSSNCNNLDKFEINDQIFQTESNFFLPMTFHEHWCKFLLNFIFFKHL